MCIARWRDQTQLQSIYELPWTDWIDDLLTTVKLQSLIGRCALPRPCWRVACGVIQEDDGKRGEHFVSLHPGKLTWNLKMMVGKMIFLFKGVNLRVCIFLLSRMIGSIERRDWEGQGLVVVEHGFVTGHYITLFWGDQTWCKCVVSLMDFPYDSALFGLVMQWPLFIHLWMVEFVLYLLNLSKMCDTYIW